MTNILTNRKVYTAFKRTVDVLGSVLLILALAPVMLLIALAVKLDSNGPSLYQAKRVGRYGQEFTMYKFRTMVEGSENMGGYSTKLNDQRFTGIARFLRRSKLDELPQLFNVFSGKMSFVGPRPQVRYYVEKYDKENRRILSVRPGVTDIASLKYGDMDKILGDEDDVDSLYEEEIEPKKNEFRLLYVDRMCFSLDVKLMVATILRTVGMNIRIPEK